MQKLNDLKNRAEKLGSFLGYDTGKVIGDIVSYSKSGSVKTAKILDITSDGYASLSNGDVVKIKDKKK